MRARRRSRLEPRPDSVAPGEADDSAHGTSAQVPQPPAAPVLPSLACQRVQLDRNREPPRDEYRDEEPVGETVEHLRVSGEELKYQSEHDQRGQRRGGVLKG